MDPHNPVTSVKDKFNSFLCAGVDLIGAVKGEQSFSTADHIRAVKGEMQDNKEILQFHEWCKTLGNLHQPKRLPKTPFTMHQTHGCLGERTGYHGDWYSTRHNGISRFLCARYNVNSPNFQKKCNSCMQTFSVLHTLICPNGCIVIARHNEICAEIIHLKNTPPLTAYTSNP